MPAKSRRPPLLARRSGSLPLPPPPGQRPPPAACSEPALTLLRSGVVEGGSSCRGAAWGPAEVEAEPGRLLPPRLAARRPPLLEGGRPSPSELELLLA